MLHDLRKEVLPTSIKLPQTLQQWWNLSFEDFKASIESLQRSPFTGQSATDWATRFNNDQTTHRAFQSNIEAAERELSERVGHAFGLTKEEFKTVMEAVAS